MIILYPPRNAKVEMFSLVDSITDNYMIEKLTLDELDVFYNRGFLLL